MVHAGLVAAPYLLCLHDWDTASALLEQALYRDGSPDTVRRIVPYLRRIADTTDQPDGEGVLGQALLTVDPVEAEQWFRHVQQASAARQDYRLTTSAAAALINLLRRRGRLAAALKLADQ